MRTSERQIARDVFLVMSIVLAITLFFSVISHGFREPDPKKWFGPGETVESSGLVVPAVTEAEGISLKAYAAEVVEDGSDGIVVEAILFPENASDKDTAILKWSVSWAAEGREDEAANYVGIRQVVDSDGSLTNRKIRVYCIKPFPATITLTCTVQLSEHSCSIPVDYVLKKDMIDYVAFEACISGSGYKSFPPSRNNFSASFVFFPELRRPIPSAHDSSPLSLWGYAIYTTSVYSLIPENLVLQISRKAPSDGLVLFPLDFSAATSDYLGAPLTTYRIYYPDTILSSKVPKVKSLISTYPIRSKTDMYGRDLDIGVSYFTNSDYFDDFWSAETDDELGTATGQQFVSRFPYYEYSNMSSYQGVFANLSNVRYYDITLTLFCGNEVWAERTIELSISNFVFPN